VDSCLYHYLILYCFCFELYFGCNIEISKCRPLQSLHADTQVAIGSLAATIIITLSAPPIKLARIKQYGAQLELSTALPTKNREVVASALAQDIASSRGVTLLHPFEDIDVVHGQGTCGMELLEQAGQLLGNTGEDYNMPSIGTIVVPCGGGGLTAGINLAVEQNRQSESIDVISVEPKGFDDHARSLQRRQRTSLAELYPDEPPSGRSVDCDALMAGAPGIKTWQINSERLSAAIESEGDASAANAMRVAFEQFRLVLEPSGALGLAAVLDGQIPLDGDRPVVVIASGGNTDLSTFARLMGCTGDNAD
jgi:threonine dehydratase